MNSFTFSVNDYRAIESADINLNGITVVCGTNGSGKSTLSKLLYHSIEKINNYEEVVKSDIFSGARGLFRLFSRIHSRLRGYYLTEDFPRQFNFDSLYNSAKSPVEMLEPLQQYVLYLKKLLNEEDEYQKARQIRVASALYSLDTEDQSVESILDILELKVNNFAGLILSYEEKLASRPMDSFVDSMQSEFHDYSPNCLKISELDAKIIAPNITKICELSTINKAVYLDTPMVVGIDVFSTENSFSHWESFNSILEKEKRHNDFETVHKISKEIIHGYSTLEEEAFVDKFVYHREDGRDFDLSECATGIRAFSALQILINNGTLDADTLMIIDEPEAHLHPQWIVEYARLIVTINKVIGTKFFITSHSTDMVSALKYINFKEGIRNSLTFYNATESTESKYRFYYKNLGSDIEDIFDSFNKSLDKIEKYGEDENDF